MSTSMPVVLNKQKHAKLTYKPLIDYSFAADMNAVPLLPFEVVEASRCLPVIFPKTDSAVPHALLGIGKENIFVDKKGGWTAQYLPLIISNYPFSLMQAQFTEAGDGEKKSELALAIVEDAPHFKKKDGLPLYDGEGESTDTLKHITTAMFNRYRRHRAFEPVIAELQKSGTLEERTVTFNQGGKERSVGGLRVASREKVFALPDETLGKWVKLGLMEMLHAHWQSLRHLEVLLKHPSCPVKE